MSKNYEVVPRRGERPVSAPAGAETGRDVETAATPPAARMAAAR
jgi:hypothetical protein